MSIDLVHLLFAMKKIVAIFLIVAAVSLSYAPAAQDGFVWDDTALILRDPLIRSWLLIPEGFNHFAFTDATASDFYRPIQRLVYTFEYAAFALNPAPYHLVSILCHAGAAVALFIFAEELLLLFGMEPKKRRLIALASALVWAIHPVHSAAVVYISGRADPLAAAFGFLGLYFVLRSSQATPKNGLFFLIVATVAFFLSALSKESGLIFPLLAIALLALRKDWPGMLKTLGIAVFVAIVYLSLRLPAEHIPPPVSHSPAPALVRPIIVVRAVAEYAGLILLPLNLHMDRGVETHPSGFSNASLNVTAMRELQTLLGIVLIAGLIYWMVRARRRNPKVFACLMLAVISYLPVSGIVALNASVAEHWLYIPTTFLFLAAAISLTDFFQNKASIIRFAAIGSVAVWALFLGTRTFLRTFDWKDQRTFLERTIASGGNSTRMLINLGGLEITEGNLENAALHLHAALEKSPDHPLAVLNLAVAALKQNDFKLTRELLNRATGMPAVAARAHELLAVLESKENGQVDFLRMRLAARTGPPNWSIEKRYIKMLDETGATAQAIGELESCLRTEWYRAESWQFLSQLLAKSGRPKPAADALAMAHDYDVHLDLHASP
ncbi:MAG: tetratricopeptide repeat protein [Verrucomicrobiota bacterium]